MAGGAYFADEDDAPVRPGRVRVLRVLLWVNAGLTAVMVVAGAIAAGVSVPVLAHLLMMAWPGAVAGTVAWRVSRGFPGTGRGSFVWLMAAAAWQIVLAVSELFGGDPRGLTSLVLPVAIVVLAVTRPVRSYLRASGPRDGDGGDGGAGLIEYAGLIVLAALILGSLVALGIPGRIGTGTSGALCRIFAESDCSTSGRRGPANAAPNANNPNGTAPNGRTRNGGAPNAEAPAVKPCGIDLGCLWKGLTTDPYDLAQRTPCTNVLTCAGHGLALVVDSEWNVTKAALDDAKGIVDLAKNPGSLIDAARYICDHPSDALRQLVWDDESAKLWNRGDYIGAVSRTIWNVGSWALPGVDIGKAFSKAGKFAKLGKLADKAGELGKLGRLAAESDRATADAAKAAKGGDVDKAESAAKKAEANAKRAEDQGREDGCKIVALSDIHVVPLLHLGGRFAVPLHGACPPEEQNNLNKAEQDKKNAAGSINEAWSRKANFPTKQLQHEYKHASDFGIKGNWSKVNGAVFKQAVQNFMRGPGVRRIRGTYRGNPAIFFYDDATKRVVYLHPNGDFWGAYGNLTPKQAFYLSRDAKFGGG